MKENDQIDFTVDCFADELRQKANLAPQIKMATRELRDLIAEKYPKATFRVSYKLDDPLGVVLIPEIDLADDEEISESCTDKLLEIQTEQRLPIFVFPERLKT